MGRRPADAAHLARRLARSLRRPVPTPYDEAWACSHLQPAVAALWQAQAAADRAHSVAVARAVLAAGERREVLVPGWVVCAALVHDVGKVGADLGVAGRAVASAAEIARVPHRLTPPRIRQYLRYPTSGAQALAAAGAPQFAVAWAREHHEPQRSWSVPSEWGDLLAAADRTAR